MAVNNGRPTCQNTYGQPTIHNSLEQDANGLQRTRTASPENGRASPTIFNPYYTGRPRTPVNGNKSNAVDRQEIIRRIKSGESRPSSPELERSINLDRQELIRRIKSIGSRPASPELERASSGENNRKRKSPTPRPATPSRDVRPKSPEVQLDNSSIGMQIERPRSALHRGDFREKEQLESSFGHFEFLRKEDFTPSLSTSPVAPWHHRFPSAALKQIDGARQPPTSQTPLPKSQQAARGRAISHASLASSFVYKPPTSPLVQSSRPDTPEPQSRGKSRSPDKLRRHTFSPRSLAGFRSALEYPPSARNHDRPPQLRYEKTFPYQAHQPRRSLNVTPFSSLPHTPSAASRRPSLSADSPLHLAPMVGSYEESILRGRMSTTPSRPLNFMAQIGVLGKGECKSYLRCPPHVSVPFPAVFYSYGSGTPANDQPSPYVGMVDLENSLTNQEEAQDKRRQRLGPLSSEGSCASSPKGAYEDEAQVDTQARRRRKQKAKRRSGSPKAPPGGSYRIPQQGQLQIVIKNPNKTAVKLFLVPYDLTDMEPGQKTFIRQRSYSAGPIIDMPLSSRKNLGTDRPEAAINATDDPNQRPMLRYLIHLHICCPSKGRYFLYRSVRVVFANRVPDGKEKLRNEIQLPEPRYSTYKPGRDSNVGIGTTTSQAADAAGRRNTLESDLSAGSRWSPRPQSVAQSLPSHEYSARYDMPLPIPTLSRHLTTLPTIPTVHSPPWSQYPSENTTADSPCAGTPSVQSPGSSSGDTPQRTVPNLEDPFRFERDRSRERRSGGQNESLLSRRLMDLAFQSQGGGGGRPEDGSY